MSRLLPVLSERVAWMPWGRAAFERARAERKAVLLSIVAEWCAASRDMDREIYSDPAIATAINGAFVPVRVDADQQPDVSERYALGGWPTTAFLGADGALLGGGTFVAAERMPPVLAQVIAAYQVHLTAPPPCESGGAHQDVGRSDGQVSDADLQSQVLASYDEAFGGFGGAPKFPLHAPVRLALALWAETREPRYREMVERSLHGMGWQSLYDAVSGGFFRCAATPDWRMASTEKLLEPNAALLRLFLDAGAMLNESGVVDRAAHALSYLQTFLADHEHGGWFASQYADERYYSSAPPEIRQQLDPPLVSSLMFADGNAAMASAALHASVVFEDVRLASFALRSLERVLMDCYKPGDGVSHFNRGGRRSRGLLADQVGMASACLDAHEATGDIVYEMMAEELMHFAVRTMWNEREGGFFDRALEAEDEPVGLMRTRLVPLVTNCDAVEVLQRLARSSGDSTFAERAAETLRAAARLAPGQGPLAAHYLLARRAVLHGG